MSWVQGVVTSTLLRMLSRKCDRCGKTFIIALSQRRETVPCPGCGAPLPPPPRPS